LAASLIWQIRERAIGSSDLGAFGVLTLALLLVEVDVALHPLGPFLGILLSGVALGLLLGFIGVRLAPRFPAGKTRGLFYLGLTYFAYLGGVLMGTSGVTMATMTGLVIAAYSYSVGLWPTQEERPAPLDQGWVFVLMAGTWLLLGWQAHVAFTAVHITGIGLALVAAAFGVLVGRWLTHLPDVSIRPLPQALLHKQGKVFLLLLGIFLLWPQEANLTLFPLAVALLAALVIIFTLRIVIYQVLDMADIEINWPGE
jgi:drug/metabolite transporter (DMT)-like permease